MQVMLNSKNIRVAVGALIVFSIVLFLAGSSSSLAPSVQRTKPASSPESVPFSGDSDEDQKNTLKGTPHGSPNPPYAKEEGNNGNSNSKGADSSKPAVIADKTANKQDASSPKQNNNNDASKPNDNKDASKSNDNNVIASSENIEVAEVGNDSSCKKEDYVVMIDAGSTGSRVHVYKFNTCQSPPVLLNEDFEMLKPGLSSFDTEAENAAKSLDPLLEVALKSVPKDKQACTPIAVKATAGLRLLGEEKSAKILEAVRNRLENEFPFAVVPGDGISIMDGSNEGVFAWITTNYLLGNIGSAEKLPTAAVFDLGGGSTQIVFEPEFPNNEQMVDGEHKFEISFGGRKYSLYQFSHLGYGLMQGRNKIHAYIVQNALKSDQKLVKLTKEKSKDAIASTTLTNPCIAPGAVAEGVQVQVGDDYYVVNMKGPTSASGASGAQCRAIAEKILNKDAECSQKPCSFNGAHQPSLTKAFKKTNDMFIFSYFYDRTNPVGLPSSFTVEELTELAKVVCNGDQMWKEVLLDEHINQLTAEPQWCLDLSFITAMLHTGYDIPLYRELKTAKTIDNNELGWCLGASLPLLDKEASGWNCKVKQTE